MPTYDYRCEKCGREFAAEQRISDRPLSRCPDCKGKATRLITGGNFILKGGGWYKDGYGSSKPSPEASGEKPKSCPGKKKSGACASCPAAEN